MMKLANCRLVIRHHAYVRYCERVEQVSQETLQARLSALLQGNDYRVERGLIELGGVWFAFSVKAERLRLITCFGGGGRPDMPEIDYPAARAWAYRHNDKIDLRRR